jgi:putative membrane protein
MRFLLKILVSAMVVMIISYILPGVKVENFLAAIAVAVVLALLNTFLKPLLVVLTIPVTIFSLGLFILVIIAGIVLLASSIVDGFHVQSFWWALLFSIINSLVSALLEQSDKQK